MALEYRDNASLVVYAELPGIDPDRDIEITIIHDVLHIRAYRASGPEPKDHPQTFATARLFETSLCRPGQLKTR